MKCIMHNNVIGNIHPKIFICDVPQSNICTQTHWKLLKLYIHLTKSLLFLVYELEVSNFPAKQHQIGLVYWKTISFYWCKNVKTGLS
jgi:hypothetical protein